MGKITAEELSIDFRIAVYERVSFYHDTPQKPIDDIIQKVKSGELESSADLHEYWCKTYSELEHKICFDTLDSTEVQLNPGTVIDSSTIDINREEDVVWNNVNGNFGVDND